LDKPAKPRPFFSACRYLDRRWGWDCATGLDLFRYSRRTICFSCRRTICFCCPSRRTRALAPVSLIVGCCSFSASRITCYYSSIGVQSTHRFAYFLVEVLEWKRKNRKLLFDLVVPCSSNFTFVAFTFLFRSGRQPVICKLLQETEQSTSGRNHPKYVKKPSFNNFWLFTSILGRKSKIHVNILIYDNHLI
jgi:hypothetical protein